jgi:iron complex transport system substrate-binding protein
MKSVQFSFKVAACLAAAAVLVGCGSAGTGRSPASSGAATSPGAASGTSPGGTGQASSGFPVTFSECGKSYTFTARPKILVDTPQAAAVVAAAGGNRTGDIVAYTEGGNEPLGAAGATMAGVPQTSKNSPPTKDVIVAAGPDLVITHSITPELASQLSAFGIQSMTVNNGCETYPAAHGGRTGYDAIYSDITLIGRLLGTSGYAASSVAAMKQSIARVEQQARALPRHSVGMIAPYAGDVYALGATSLEDAELRSLNMTDAFSAMNGSFVPVSAEKLIALNPWAIVIAYSPGYGSDEAQSIKALTSLPGADQMDAVKNKRVIVVDDVYLTARPADAVQLLYTKLRALS